MLIWFISGLVDLKYHLLLISFFLLFLMHHIATHNIGLGSLLSRLCYTVYAVLKAGQKLAKLSTTLKLLKAKARPSPIK